MRHVDYQRMAADIFRLAASKRLSLEITPVGLENSEPKISISSEEEGKYTGEISVRTNAITLTAKIWLVEVGDHVFAHAYIIKYQNHLEQREIIPTLSWVQAVYSVFPYAIECGDCN